MKKAVWILLISLVSLSLVFAFQYAKFYDNKLHVVFCDVGQGDAIFIRTPKGLDILVDGGPDDKVLSCLGKYMPFWDRDLEMVILTHPHADHSNGLISVLDRYKVDLFVTEMIKNKTGGFSRLMDELRNQNIAIQYVFAGDRFKFKDGVILNIVGPSKEYIQTTSPGGVIGERSEFASVLSLIEYKDFEVLLTGDSQASGLEESLRLSFDKLRIAQAFGSEVFDSEAQTRGAQARRGKISILQVPHHGSKTGLNSEILDVLKPELAVISVGKNNYGHPTAQTIKILREKDIKILRTDEKEDIELVSDGKSWGVRN